MLLRTGNRSEEQAWFHDEVIFVHPRNKGRLTYILSWGNPCSAGSCDTTGVICTDMCARGRLKKALLHKFAEAPLICSGAAQIMQL
jgi:hypothetical protein